MVSFDLSTTNIILTGAVVGLLAFFIILLIKLNPSAERKEAFETERETQIKAKAPKPPQTISVATQPTPDTRIETPKAAERPVLTVGPTISGSSLQTKQETQAPAPVLDENREIPRSLERTPTSTFRENRDIPNIQEKSGAHEKMESTPARKDCLHHFGYLRTFPKNSPIPDECFGCEKIVDCLVTNKKPNGKNERLR